MLFSCLISSVSAGLTNTASPSLTPPINDCVHGAMDHRYMVTLKQQAASSNLAAKILDEAEGAEQTGDAAD